MTGEIQTGENITSFNRYSIEMRTALSLGLYSHMDTPSKLWSLQKKVSGALPNLPEEIKDLLKITISNLEALCQEARGRVVQVLYGDEWFKHWQ